jgi:hypothetical protein
MLIQPIVFERVMRSTSVAVAAACLTMLACSSSSERTDGGTTGDGGLVPTSCLLVSSCEITPTKPSLVSNAANICMQENGTPGTTCPTANLVGCCTISGGEQCYYTNSVDADSAAEDCTGGGGSWSTNL